MTEKKRGRPVQAARPQEDLNEAQIERLIAEYQAAGYSIGLTNEAADEYQVEERQKQRFLLYKIVVADRRVTSAAEMKMIYHLLFTRYNDRTGQCDPGPLDFYKHTGLSEATVRRTKAKIRKTLGYLVYDEKNKGGSQGDTTQYSFAFPPLSGLIGVKTSKVSTDKTTPIKSDATPIESDRGTPIKVDSPPLSRLIGKLTTEHLTEHLIEHGAFASQTTPATESASKVQEAKKGKEARKVRKRTSEGETIGRPLSQSEVTARLEAVKPKGGTEASMVCAHCGIADDTTMAYRVGKQSQQVRLHLNCYSAFHAENFPPPPPEEDTDPLVWPPDPNKQPFLN